MCRKAGISQATNFNWKKMFGGLLPSEVKRLRRLEEGNGRLTRIVADLSLDKEMLQESSAVDHLRGTWCVSIRRACRVLEADPKMYRYKSRRGDQLRFLPAVDPRFLLPRQRCG